MVTKEQTELVLTGLKLVTVVLGFYIVYLGYRAYTRQREATILWLTIGMAVLTAGAISEGAAYSVLGWTLAQSHIFEAVVTLLGFAVLVYSLHAR